MMCALLRTSVADRAASHALLVGPSETMLVASFALFVSRDVIILMTSQERSQLRCIRMYCLICHDLHSNRMMRHSFLRLPWTSRFKFHASASEACAGSGAYAISGRCFGTNMGYAEIVKNGFCV